MGYCITDGSQAAQRKNTHNPTGNRSGALKSINAGKPFGLSVTTLRNNNNNNNKLLHVLVIGIVYSYIDGGEK